jgi:diaminopimelate dehydrogenase
VRARVDVRKSNVAVIGFGRLGRACALALQDLDDLALAGVVRRSTSPTGLCPPFAQASVVVHVRELPRVEVALVCVPAEAATGVACELLQAHIPVVECAALEGQAQEAHYDAIARAARHHRVAAVVGAGWDPGMLSLFHRAFETLIPHGRTESTRRPGASLHHSEAVAGIEGVKDALVTESRDTEGRPTRYVYLELAKGAKLDAVEATLAADPLFAGERTLAFEVESAAALEAEGRGVLLERLGAPRGGPHGRLLLEARFDLSTFAARVMLDAAKRIRGLGADAHRYALSPAERGHMAIAAVPAPGDGSAL